MKIKDPISEVSESSIDEYFDDFDNSLEEEANPFISPLEEFWAHSSNLQVWEEQDYDTRLLHSNLAFPLLKKLTKLGDFRAKKIFKEEIVKRFRLGNENLRRYPIQEGYISLLNEKEKEILYENNLDIKKKLDSRLKTKLRIASDISGYHSGIELRMGKIIKLKIDDSDLTLISVNIQFNMNNR